MAEQAVRLRQDPRQPQRLPSTGQAKRAVEDLNRKEAETSKDERAKKTYGRTLGGTVFTVPQTHDMVSQLLSPTEPKNFGDICVLLILGLHILALWLLPSILRIPTFAAVFLFWRACYNLGIGYLLHQQSNHRRLVAWAKKYRLFANPRTEDNPQPMLYYLIKREMETKIPADYKFEEAPIEYNTWLLFRRFVDLVLMCDFVSYCCFAAACGGSPEGESMPMTILRWVIGWGLVGFNLWVKLDAHRVVKDYAWYWGDFFYLIDQELTFDGVFEMAPHPMYSVGYAGYYGISLMAASYNVLFISIIAHAAQFAFLVWVENPHIEKTYNAPPPKKRMLEPSPERIFQPEDPDGILYTAPPLANPSQPSPVHNLLGLRNIDLFRITDVSVLLLQLYTLVLTASTPDTLFYQAIFVINAALWRSWYSLGVGYILNRQSAKKNWTRHFLKYGESTEEAWRQWKGMYHLSMTMCYASFAAAAWKMYTPPDAWNTGGVLLKHVLAAGLVGLQVWTAVSIYESLGEFGWFFGDFFFDHAPKLTYSGIYRFLNNPERIIGLAGVWGAVLVTGSSAIFFLALLSHTLSLFFIQFVERPHMQKLYGRTLRRESGLSRSLRRSLPPPLRQWQGSVDKMLHETVDLVEDFIEATQPKLAQGFGTFIQDTRTLFKHPARITISRLEPDLADFNPKDYSLKVTGTPVPRTLGVDGQLSDKASQHDGAYDSLVLAYGAPIRVTWTAPVHHSKKDWIGMYMVADNPSREATKVSSAGRWVPTNRDQYDSMVADRGILDSDTRVLAETRRDGETTDYLTGEVEFSGDKLWFTTGVFEFRYHHNGKHNVMAISRPFEIGVPRFEEGEAGLDDDCGLMMSAVEQALLPLVRDCFDRDPDIAPNTVIEGYGTQVEREWKYSTRVVFAVSRMFGIEFAPEVVQADGNVKNLAWRICNAKKVLAPFSMSSSKGTSTPTSIN